MSNRVHIIVPQTPGHDASALSVWLKQLPELRLIADISVTILPWSTPVSGNAQDWLNTIGQVKHVLAEETGVVVWAPDQSLLELSGAIALALPDPGKPVVCFNAPFPSKDELENSFLMGLKSTLINSVFSSCADIGEVLVLYESKLFKPSTCQWQVRPEDGTLVVAAEKPIAIIDFSLRLQGDYRHRRKEPLLGLEYFAFSDDVYVQNWFPGVPQAQAPVKDVPKAMVVMTDAQYWEHKALQEMRKRFQEQHLPVIWYSQTPWAKPLSGLEVEVSQTQPWWTVLAARASFGSFSEAEKAVEHLRHVTR